MRTQLISLWCEPSCDTPRCVATRRDDDRVSFSGLRIPVSPKPRTGTMTLQHDSRLLGGRIQPIPESHNRTLKPAHRHQRLRYAGPEQQDRLTHH
jgi:hypothetical protein